MSVLRCLQTSWRSRSPTSARAPKADAPGPQPSLAEAPTAQTLPLEVLELAFAHLDTLSLHFAAQTCRAWYTAAQRPQRAQCALRSARTPKADADADANANAHAQLSPAARLQARWLVGLVGPQSTCTLPDCIVPAQQPMRMAFAGRVVVLCDAAGACLIAARGVCAMAPRHTALSHIVDFATRPTGELLSLTRDHLRLHRADAARMPCAAQIAWPQAPPTHVPHSVAASLWGALALTRSTAQLRLYHLPSLHLAYALDVRCDAAALSASGALVYTYCTTGVLRAYHAPTGTALWQATTDAHARMTVLDESVLLDTRKRIVVWDAQGHERARYRARFAHATYHRTPSPEHMLVVYRDGHDASMLCSRILQRASGAVVGGRNWHAGIQLAVSEDGCWLAALERAQLSLTCMVPPPTFLRRAV